LPSLSTSLNESTQTLSQSIADKTDIEVDYDFGEMLGSGAFAVVYKGTKKETGEQVAIKKIKKNIVKENEMKVPSWASDFIFVNSLFLRESSNGSGDYEKIGPSWHHPPD
jgi:serine/threonine protein kinase